VDNRSWRESIETGEQTDKLPHDVQKERSPMGAIGCGSGVRELELPVPQSLRTHYLSLVCR
jgi:hypothetical protein